MPPRAPYIVAFDIASNTGIAQGYAGDAPKLSSVLLGDNNINDALKAQRAHKFFSKIFYELALLEITPSVYIEKPIGTGAWGKTNFKTNEILTGLYWIAMGCIPKGVNPQIIAVASVRKSFIGHGRAQDPKKRVQEVCDVLKWQYKNNDESDAAALWYFGSLKEAPQLTPIVNPLFLARAGK